MKSLEKSILLHLRFTFEDYLEHSDRGHLQCLPTKIIVTIYVFNTSYVPGTLNISSHLIFITVNPTR